MGSVFGGRCSRPAKPNAFRRPQGLFISYRLHCLQRARHYPDLCANFDCPVYQHPVDRLGMLNTIRGDWGLTSDRPADRRTADVGSHVCNLCDRNSRPASSLAFIPHRSIPNAYEQLSTQHSNAVPPAGRCYQRSHSHVQPTSQLGCHGSRLSLLGLITIWVVLVGRCCLSSQRLRWITEIRPWIQSSLSHRLRRY